MANSSKPGAKKAKDRVKWIHRMPSPWIPEDGFLWPIARITASRFSTRTGSSWTNGKQFGRPSGVSIDKNDTIYVVDSQSNASLNPGFKRGLRVGSAKDGKVTAYVPFAEPEPDKNNNAGMEGVAADAMGNVYVGETTTQILKKYVRAARSN